MAAPFDPLPFDPRGACYCHKQCPDFKKPTTRIWVTVPGAPPPFTFLDDGILFLIGVIGPGPPDLCGPGQQCAYVPASIPTPMNSGFLCKLLRGVTVIGGIHWRITINFDLFVSYIADGDFPGLGCRENTAVPFFEGPFGPLDAAVTQVRWFENANDVPH